jgi:hypothetical protein
METDLKNLARSAQTRFSFGATSAIITNLGIITGLDTLTHPKLSIIGALLVIALADNLSDTFGIHIYQESEYLGTKEVADKFLYPPVCLIDLHPSDNTSAD